MHNFAGNAANIGYIFCTRKKFGEGHAIYTTVTLLLHCGDLGHLSLLKLLTELLSKFRLFWIKDNPKTFLRFFVLFLTIFFEIIFDIKKY